MQSESDRCDDNRAVTTVTATSPTAGTRFGDEPPSDSEFPRGTSIGRYIVIEPLGTGGMGAVYRAFDPDLNRPVALKVLRSDGATQTGDGESTGRLMREAQALAQLSHPNVVAIHDVGLHDDRVFLAMELVEGRTVRAWLRDGPPLAEALRVFAAAGEGLAAAHDRGLVHRDVKPSNIIVANDGRVRVLDFGLARAEFDADHPYLDGAGDRPADDDESLDSGSGSDRSAITPASERSAMTPTSGTVATRALSAPLTRAGAVMGTPRYMAPEQHLGNAVTARTDQFSFCVGLYEAVYGQRPFVGRTLREQRGNVCQGEIVPPPPDVRVPAQLRRLIMRGLQVNPKDRYPDMRALLADLARCSAAPRRRLVAGAGGLAVAIVIAGFALRSGAAEVDRCAGGDETFAEAWNDDRRAAVRAAFIATDRSYAEATAERLGRTMDETRKRWIAMHRRTCEATFVRGTQSEALLDLKMRCLQRKRDRLGSAIDLFSTAPDPGVVDKSLQTVLSLSSLATCEDGESLSRAVPLPDDPIERLRIDAVQRKLDTVAAMEEAGQWKRGADIARQLHLTADAIDYLPARAEVAYWHAAMVERNGDWKAAEPLFRGALRMAAEARDHRLLAKNLTELIRVAGYFTDLELSEARALYDTAEAAVVLAGGDPGLRLDVLREMGALAFNASAYDEAWTLFRAYRETALLLDATRAQHLALADMNLGLVLHFQGQYAESRRHLTQAETSARTLVGPDHPDTVLMAHNLGHVLVRQGALAEARAPLTRSLEIAERTLPDDHWLLVLSLGALAEHAIELGAWDDAERYLDRYEDLVVATVGRDHIWYAWGQYMRGRLQLGTGDVAAATPTLEAALERWRALTGDAREDTGLTLSALGESLLAAGRAGDAIEPLEQALRVLDVGDAAALRSARSSFALARALWAVDRDRDRARALARRARAATATSPHAADRAANIARWMTARNIAP